jgi:gas vesicle protein
VYLFFLTSYHLLTRKNTQLRYILNTINTGGRYMPTNTRSSDQRKKMMGAVAAGVAGAAIGATAAVILSDKKKRDRIVSTVKDLQQKGEELSERIASESDEVRERVSNKAQGLKGKVESGVDQAKDSARPHLKK